MTPLVVTVSIDKTTWTALAVVLTVLGLAWTWFSFHRRGPAAGLRALAWTLVPVALYLTGTLKLVAQVAGNILTWASNLVLSPTVWAGVGAAGLAVVLFLVSGAMLTRGVGVRSRRERAVEPVSEGDVAPRRDLGGPRHTGAPAAPAVPAQRPVQRPVEPALRGRGRSSEDDDMADVEAILKKHGI